MDQIVATMSMDRFASIMERCSALTTRNADLEVDNSQLRKMTLETEEQLLKLKRITGLQPYATDKELLARVSMLVKVFNGVVG